MTDLDAQLATIRERSAALPDLPVPDLIRHVVARSQVRLRPDQFNEALTEGTAMLADECTRTVVHHEWILLTPAHYTEVAKALAVAEQKHDGEPGNPTDIVFNHRDGEIVIGYSVEQHPAVIADAVDRVLRAERDMLAERLSLARQALARHPHFDGSPIGNDVAPRITELLIHLDGRIDSLTAAIDRVRQLATAWQCEDAEFGRHWHEASRALHEVLDGPGSEGGGQ